MKASVDPDLCIGCGLCADLCPAVFAMSGELAIVTADPVPTESELACRDATEQCPVSAITLS